MLTILDWLVDACPKAIPTTQAGDESFYRWLVGGGEVEGRDEWEQGGATAEAAQSALTVTPKLVIWAAASCFKDSCPSVPGPVAPVSLWPLL